MGWESKWDCCIEKSQGLLDRFTKEAAKELRAGRTEAKGFDKL